MTPAPHSPDIDDILRYYSSDLAFMRKQGLSTDEYIKKRRSIAKVELTRYFQAEMLKIVGGDIRQEWNEEDGFCERCGHQPTDDTRNCICVFVNNSRVMLRKAISEWPQQGSE